MSEISPPSISSQESLSRQLWDNCVNRLSQDLTQQQMNSWIKPLFIMLSEDQGTVTVFVANRFKLDWIRTQYAGKIEAILESLLEHPIKLELTITPRSREPSEASSPDDKSKENLIKQPVHHAIHTPHIESGVSLNAPVSGLAPLIPKSPISSSSTRLNPHLTFDNLVEGTANRMGRAAAYHVAASPGHMYNPLFIYGGVGLGKTHLMHAIGNKLLADRSDANVLYLHAEQFVTDVVKAVQRKAFDEFKERYHSLDLLLIDDVQFFANKDRTQEEFFNAFEALLAKKSHMVMTSDIYPKGLTHISERLVSRFDSGLAVAIEPPELEMRVAILMTKAENEKIAMPDDVAFFIAKHVRSNVRELEGALRKVLAFSRFNNKELSIFVAKEALKDLLSIQNQQISIENIQKTVADFFKIKLSDMYSKKRTADIVLPRQIAMYLTKKLSNKGLPEIGSNFGGRDHTTVLHAVRKIEKDRQQQAELNKQIHILEQTIKG